MVSVFRVSTATHGEWLALYCRSRAIVRTFTHQAHLFDLTRVASALLIASAAKSPEAAMEIRNALWHRHAALQRLLRELLVDLGAATRPSPADAAVFACLLLEGQPQPFASVSRRPWCRPRVT